MDIGKLDKLYKDAEQCDDQLFSEMRSNVLLVSGDHYNQRATKFWDRVQDTKGIKDAAKLRLTKNHTATICRRKIGKVLSHAPNTMVTPNNQDEMQDQKTAELNDAVWKFEKKKQKMRSKVRMWAEDFINLGECWCKVFWDDTKGEVIGYEPKVDEDGCELCKQTTSIVMNEYGQQVEQVTEEQIPDEEKPVMSGDFVFERVFAFNIMRDPNSQSLEDSPYVIVRKMIDKSTVKKIMGDDFSKYENEEESYLVFDSDKANYAEEKNKIMLREFYYRPCLEYPEGYFYITVQGHIIDEGKLPFSVFPIVFAGHTEIPTSARFRSPIKQMRPYQIEINRSASKIAETQITLGDDKLILNNNAKISSGGTLAGIRGVKVSGGGDDIKVLAGRSGEQYLPYMQSQIAELYQVMDEMEADAGGQFDAYAMLYHSSRNKERYKKYAEEFEEFLVNITELFLQLAKEYYDEERIIPMIGKSEIVNMAEFKHSEKNSFRIKIENIADDTDTMMGRQLAINHVLQYVGKDLGKDNMGKAIKAMPYMNDTEMFDDLTIDYDMSKNDMLAMERGEMPPIGKHDDHEYLIKRATGRTKKADYRFLPDQIKGLYDQYTKAHQEIAAQAAIELKRLESGFIPTSGPKVKADFYTTTAEGKVERQVYPSDALEWLKKQLEAQGTTMQPFTEMSDGVQADMARMVNQSGQQQQPM